MKDEEHEQLIASLNDDTALFDYKTPCDGYRPSIIPLALGKLLVFFGNIVYGRKPSYQKFKAVEVIARIPYQSWEVASYTFLTALYSNETKAIELAKTSNFSRVAQDNETMHVVVISQIVKRERVNNIILHSLIPLIFAFFYFWAIFILYAVRPRWALELNYLFEDHAFSQYDRFIKENEEELKQKNVGSEFLHFYGRHAMNQYELFRSIRNDEIVHRNRSLRRALEL